MLWKQIRDNVRTLEWSIDGWKRYGDEKEEEEIPKNSLTMAAEPLKVMMSFVAVLEAISGLVFFSSWCIFGKEKGDGDWEYREKERRGKFGYQWDSNGQMLFLNF